MLTIASINAECSEDCDKLKDVHVWGIIKTPQLILVGMYMYFPTFSTVLLNGSSSMKEAYNKQSLHTAYSSF